MPCTHKNWFVDLTDAEETIAAWKTPAEVAAAAASAGLQSPPAPSAPLMLEAMLKSDRVKNGNRTLQVD